MAYLGFSVPVVVIGALMEHLGQADALAVFGLALLGACLLVYGWLWRRSPHSLDAT
ncbi:hypothetical protein [Halomonas stenophila]|uniref:Uncharacterized protein n=1 Tax=Halomonas stenophila TaxID=795312 RepID=A0A7W5EQ32_9GAMM|nr:hypothetical protein [Halomonas stenophila]MBB3229369.1 hypothetical protein [Halomonas stenophila]